MPELLYIKTPEFELSVWSNDISKRRKTYMDTIGKRNKNLLNGEGTLQKNISYIYFYPMLKVINVECENKSLVQDESYSISEIELPNPLFFENVQYQFEWIFHNNIHVAELLHKSLTLNSSFRFVQAHRNMPARLVGTFNTENNVGWMRLPLEYKTDNQTIRHEISFEVLPSKMDLHTDLPVMYEAIDQIFPLWRFSLVEKTEQNSANSHHRGNFPLMWLANFSRLRERFEKGLKVIAQAPHSRLQAHSTFIKADRLKGRINQKNSIKIREDKENGYFNKKYKIEIKKLSVDTQENRFIKSVVLTCQKKLFAFEKALRKSDPLLEKQRFSEAFLNELHQWQYPLKKILANDFFNEVGNYTEKNKESLVLQQKTGYSTVYRVWQDLKFYLDKFGSISTISMKSVAEIYEVWCFLTLKNILQDELGFEEIITGKNKLELNEYFEYQFKNGNKGAFEFIRGDGVKARLAHEPRFTKSSTDIRSYSVNQEPDIVLEIESTNGKRFVWLFDAKYRIKNNDDRFGNKDSNDMDYVPDDAINQMHRYRDALIEIRAKKTSAGQYFLKSRPVIGAFALYPGNFDQLNPEVGNPYQKSIDEIGIGAFALLPNNKEGDKSGYHWLLTYLSGQIEAVQTLDEKSGDTFSEKLYLQEPARIPYSGVKQFLYPDLIMTAALTENEEKNDTYFDSFRNGVAQSFSLPTDLLVSKYSIHILNEIRYLGLAIPSVEDTSIKNIDKIWPVKKIDIILSNDTVQRGSDGKQPSMYYKFELGQPLLLMNNISNIPDKVFTDSIILTTLERLENIKDFTKLKCVYSGLVY